MYRLIVALINKNQTIEKYSIQFEPELPDTSTLRNKVTGLAKEEITKKLAIWMPYGNSIYSRTLAKDVIKADVTHDEVAYKVTLS